MSLETALAGLIVGSVGDFTLQTALDSNLGTERFRKALAPYFAQWTPESAIISAGLLTSAWSFLFEWIGLGGGGMGFILFSMILDDAYRVFHPWIYPSLKSYYEVFDWNETRVFNAITALLVILVRNFIQ